MEKILVIEDDRRTAKIIADYFISSGFDVSVASDGDEGLSKFNKEIQSLIILDIMLPGIDGYSVCRKIRKVSDIPIIILTARTYIDDQLYGYELKADDYITKPFNPEVLVAKAGIILSRSSKQKPEKTSAIFDINGIKVDGLSRKVFIDNKLVELENKQFEILLYFFEHRNIVLSREKLMNAIWGYDYIGNSRVVDAQIKKLRSKLAHKAYTIKTEFGVGYMFEAK